MAWDSFNFILACSNNLTFNLLVVGLYKFTSICLQDRWLILRALLIIILFRLFPYLLSFLLPQYFLCIIILENFFGNLVPKSINVRRLLIIFISVFFNFWLRINIWPKAIFNFLTLKLMSLLPCNLGSLCSYLFLFFNDIYCRGNAPFELI